MNIARHDVETQELVRQTLSAMMAKKAQNPLVIDISDLVDFTDYFIITSGLSTRQTQAIADHIVETLKENRETRPYHVEGYEHGYWILIDYGDMVIHIFLEEAREYYALEDLWASGRMVELKELGFENNEDGR